MPYEDWEDDKDEERAWQAYQTERRWREAEAPTEAQHEDPDPGLTQRLWNYAEDRDPRQSVRNMSPDPQQQAQPQAQHEDHDPWQQQSGPRPVTDQQIADLQGRMQRGEITPDQYESVFGIPPPRPLTPNQIQDAFDARHGNVPRPRTPPAHMQEQGGMTQAQAIAQAQREFQQREQAQAQHQGLALTQNEQARLRVEEMIREMTPTHADRMGVARLQAAENRTRQDMLAGRISQDNGQQALHLIRNSRNQLAWVRNAPTNAIMHERLNHMLEMERAARQTMLQNEHMAHMTRGLQDGLTTAYYPSGHPQAGQPIGVFTRNSHGDPVRVETGAQQSGPRPPAHMTPENYNTLRGNALREFREAATPVLNPTEAQLDTAIQSQWAQFQRLSGGGQGQGQGAGQGGGGQGQGGQAQGGGAAPAAAGLPGWLDSAMRTATGQPPQQAAPPPQAVTDRLMGMAQTVAQRTDLTDPEKARVRQFVGEMMTLLRTRQSLANFTQEERSQWNRLSDIVEGASVGTWRPGRRIGLNQNNGSYRTQRIHEWAPGRLERE